MRILVVGAGSTGGFFGERLAAAGRDVTFLVRPGRAEQLRQRGLRVLADGVEDVVTPVLVTADKLDGTYDLVLVSVRSTALAAAMDDFAPAVGPQTVIVPFLNGLSHIDTLTARFGAAVLGGVVKVATVLNEQGDIVLLGSFTSITVGELDGRESARLEQVRQVLSGAGFDIGVSSDIITAMWAKWAFITTLGGMTCLMRAPVGDIVAAPGGELLGPALLAEAAAVASAAGHPLPAAETSGYTAMVTQPGSSLTASMYRDLVAGRPVEVEPVYGDLTARARDLGVATPLLDLATLSLRIYQAKPEALPGLDRFDLDEIAEALSDQTDYEHHWLVDPKTGEMVYWTSDTGIDGHNPIDLEELDHLVVIHPLPSYEWYQDMADFAEEVSDERAGRRLERSIQGRGAFRRFRDELHQEYPELLPAWHDFRDERARRRAVEWLADNSLVETAAAQAYYAAHPDPAVP